MLTAEEKKAALWELSFNWLKALKLFFFCLAAFSVGLTALYWTLDEQYGQRLEAVKAQLLRDMGALEEHYSYKPVASLYEGVVAFGGKADFDATKAVVIPSAERLNKEQLVAVKGQRREVAPSVYEVRFIAVAADSAAQTEATAD